MILPIHLYGSSVLRKISEPINKDKDEINEIVNNMFETMYNANGIGLSAPQVGINKRIIVVDATSMSNEFKELKDFKKIFINPIETEIKGNDYLFDEGCLSLPGIGEKVNRKSEICLEYLDENLSIKKECFKGIKARILMHEYDHLEGVLFIDHLSPIKRKMLKSKLKSIIKGKIKINYKTTKI